VPIRTILFNLVRPAADAFFMIETMSLAARAIFVMLAFAICALTFRAGFPRRAAVHARLARRWKVSFLVAFVFVLGAAWIYAVQALRFVSHAN
jgi:hypothetical protein